MECREGDILERKEAVCGNRSLHQNWHLSRDLNRKQVNRRWSCFITSTHLFDYCEMLWIYLICFEEWNGAWKIAIYTTKTRRQSSVIYHKLLYKTDFNTELLFKPDFARKINCKVPVRARAMLIRHAIRRLWIIKVDKISLVSITV